jgi:threonine dehydratase
MLVHKLRTKLMHKIDSRGACNAVISEKEKFCGLSFPGVVTHSSGNHGQAVAWAASKGT